MHTNWFNTWPKKISCLQQSFLEELEKTVALLAFEDVSNCPVGELLDISQRLKTASEVNAAILTSQSHEKGKCICHLIFNSNICYSPGYEINISWFSHYKNIAAQILNIKNKIEMNK